MMHAPLSDAFVLQGGLRRGRALIEAAGRKATGDAPLAWFGMEPDGDSPGAAMTLRIWPGDITVDIGRMDFHGRWVNWKGWI